MSSTRKVDKYLLIQWNNGGREVVNQRSVINPGNEAKVGAVVTIFRTDEKQTATIIGSSRDREILEQQISPQVYDEETAGPSASQEDPGDFSASVSSWEPSDESSDDDEEVEVEDKKIKLEKYRRSYSNRRTSKNLKPCHRANAINVIMENNRKRRQEESKRKHDKTNAADVKKSLPDSTRKNNSPTPNNPTTDTVTVNVHDLLNMKKCFTKLFQLMKEIKSYYKEDKNDTNVTNKAQPVKREIHQTLQQCNEEEYRSDVSMRSQSEESNRSDDNVLISNKYENIAVKDTKVLKIQAESNKPDDNVPIKNKHDSIKGKKVSNRQNNNQKQSDSKESEWIPIGSGKTLIHKDQFRKVNWKSYTIATRTLLLAVFPRRILATHSLTGKRSPAFQNKPAKMCLDPKIVTDVIIEITDRFKVKENLVRTIITTKCADECKMYKMRMKRKTMPSKNQENVKPAPEENNAPNQTF